MSEESGTVSILSKAKRQKRGPLIATIAGAPGTGKSTLAATFPEPFLIQTIGEAVPDDVPEEMRPVQIGATETVEFLMQQLSALVKEDHGYKTLIIDSVTGLETMFADDVMRKDPKAKSINQAMGGWGASRSYIGAQHARVRRAAELLRAKGMHVIFIAHADITRIDPPDSEGYNQYSLRLHEKSIKPYIDDVDLVGFLKQETFVRGEEGATKRAYTTNQINMVAHLTPEYMSKNRLGITEEIPVEKGQNPLAKFL